MKKKRNGRQCGDGRWRAASGAAVAGVGTAADVGAVRVRLLVPFQRSHHHAEPRRRRRSLRGVDPSVTVGSLAAAVAAARAACRCPCDVVATRLHRHCPPPRRCRRCCRCWWSRQVDREAPDGGDCRHHCYCRLYEPRPHRYAARSRVAAAPTDAADGAFVLRSRYTTTSILLKSSK